MNVVYLMKILIIGSGGREYAICQKLLQNGTNCLYYIGNSENAGLNDLVIDKYVGNILDHEVVLQKVNEWNIEFTVIGPETPLGSGLVDFWNKTVKNVLVQKNRVLE